MPDRGEQSLELAENSFSLLSIVTIQVVNGLKFLYRSTIIRIRPRRIRRSPQLKEPAAPFQHFSAVLALPGSTSIIFSGLKAVAPDQRLYRVESEEGVKLPRVGGYEDAGSLRLRSDLPELPVLGHGGRPDFFLPRQGLNLQPPNAQRLFSPNYYRPAAPRPEVVPNNNQRLRAVNFPEDLIPEAFNCELMLTIMDNPVRVPQTNQICDGAAILRALAHKPENPFNRQPMKMEDAKPELALRAKIGAYVDQIVQAVQDKQRAMGTTALQRSDYEAINEAVTSRMDAQSAASAPPRP